MCSASDMDLLRIYARQNSEAAFAELVQRHLSLVYSAAIRQVGVAAQAEEITQAVFIILAGKAASLRPGTILEGWLFETARLTALSFLRGERRRQFREQEIYMQSTFENANEDSTWNQLAPLLDEAMSRLGQKDRDALVLRFFKEKNVRDVAAAMRMSEPAVQRRILRALEKMRKLFAKRGVTSSAAVIAENISAYSVQAAHVTLAKSVVIGAIAKGSIATVSTMILVKGAMNMMAWLKLKFAAGVSAVVLLTGGAAVLAVGMTANLWPTPLVLSNNGYTWKIGGIVSSSGQLVAKTNVTAGGANAIGDFTKWVFNEWKPNLQTLNQLPQLLLLQPAKTSDHLVPFEMIGKNRYFAKNKSVKELLASVSSRKYPHAKLDFPASLPEGKFDCLVTVQGTNWWEALESVINKRFNLVEQDEHQAGETVVVVKKAN